MARSRTRYRCSSCGAEQASWFGQCPRCRSWNALEPLESKNSGTSAGRARPRGGSRPVPIHQAGTGSGGEVRTRTRIQELDRVLGGGLVAGSLVLLGGDPGVGKSTLLLAVCARLAARGLPVLYVSGEESARQVRLRADRIGVGGETLFLLPETDTAAIERALDEVRPRLLVLDSVQVLRVAGVEALPGSVSQVRALADLALGWAKGRGIATVLVGHVTREGTLAGPKALEHLVDTVIYFECDGRSPLRVLRAVKNRFGAAGELGLFEMRDRGLEEVPDASARLLEERDATAPGTAVVAGMEGSRPLLVELQALVGPASERTPARTTSGVDRSRLSILLAVLDKLELPLVERDVYVNAAGGIRLHEPAADLGIVASVYSSLADRPLPPHQAYFGEVGLTAEVRGVSYPGPRLEELARHGFRTVCLPRSVPAEAVPSSLEVIRLRTVRELLQQLTA